MHVSYNTCFVERNISCLPVTTLVFKVPLMALGKRVQHLREERGWKQAHLCALVNAKLSDDEKLLTQQALSNLESRDSATSEAAPYLAEVFGVSLRWLLCGKGRSDDTDWPFRRVDRARWDACGDEDRGYVQAAVNRALDECEASRSKASALFA